MPQPEATADVSSIPGLHISDGEIEEMAQRLANHIAYHDEELTKVCHQSAVRAVFCAGFNVDNLDFNSNPNSNPKANKLYWEHYTRIQMVITVRAILKIERGGV